MTVAGQNSGYVRAVSVCVVGAGISRHEAFAVDDTRRLHVGGLQVIVLIDTTIDDRDADSSSVNAIALPRLRIVDWLGSVVPCGLVRAIRRNVLHPTL